REGTDRDGPRPRTGRPAPGSAQGDRAIPRDRGTDHDGARRRVRGQDDREHGRPAGFRWPADGQGARDRDERLRRPGDAARPHGPRRPADAHDDGLHDDALHEDAPRPTPRRTLRNDAAPRGVARPVARAGDPAQRRFVRAAAAQGGPREVRRGPHRVRTLRLGDPKRRLRFGLIGLAVVLTLFVGRIVQLQALDASAYAADANSLRMQTVRLPAERGSIVDANGVTLADSVDAFDITADPTQVQQYNPTATAAALAPIVGGDPVKIEEQLRTPKSRYVVVAKQVDPSVWTKIKQTQKEFSAAKRDDLVGIYAGPHSKRIYPAGPVGANLVGFVNATDHGAGGMELAFDKLLAGKDGSATYENSLGRQVPTGGKKGKDAVPGENVQLTIDRNIQWYAEQMIAQKVAEAGAESGTVVVQDVKSGEVLAMATSPGFDPNRLASANRDDMGNRAMQEAYEPGSTSKVMTMAAVIQEGVATPETKVTVPGVLPRADRVFHDDVDHGTWQLTLNGVLAKSSNIGTILAAEHLGPDQAAANAKLYEYLTKFGIGSKSGINFPGETAGLLPQPQKWDGAQQYTIPFGQGLSVNSLQATSVYQTIANGGVRIAPTLVKGTLDEKGKLTPNAPPQRTEVVSPQTARTVADMMESVVADDEGTGNKAQIPGYRVAGKTGTANRVDPKTGTYNGYTSSFIGFAPADNPQIVVSVTIQAPTNGKWGGNLCAPVFKDVMSFALQTRKVPPNGTKSPEIPVEFKS
ncbi:penicillin-binding transpeptidase domain-containing protein, partial [Uniformispora flossi]|uniref:peptidoglycan D,D-transpeptidase FtsI family protein n=1 Tax=Uniformispora flossi TaxID=3390723 RepID=UPI003D03C090